MMQEDAGGWYKRLTPEAKQKRRARGVVHMAIKRGTMQRLPCSVCGNPNSEAHHHKGYDPINARNVIFLCKDHHIDVEKRI